jgi:carotenoid 1,2-hydratase
VVGHASTRGQVTPSGALHRERQRSSGGRSANGGVERTAGRLASASGPRFDTPVSDDGYAWWYFDGVSDDGRTGLTVIAFVGSVFSPFYYGARQTGPADPENFCALNIAVYGRDGKTWAFTEHPRHDVLRDERRFQIGTSRIEWRGDHLAAYFDEPTLGGGRIRGRVYLYPHHVFGEPFDLDNDHLHRWWAVAPAGRIVVKLDEPDLHFNGSGYHDANDGDEPIEAGFHDWTWTRLDSERGTTVLYDARPREGGDFHLARTFTRDGTIEPVQAPPRVGLPSTFWWRFPRGTRSAGDARVLRTFEDSPFYSRSLIETDLGQGPVRGVHESLSLDRFATPWMQWMLPYRILRLE